MSAVQLTNVFIYFQDTQSIKGESRADIEAQQIAEAAMRRSHDGDNGSEKVTKSRGNTPDADKLLTYYHLMQGMSAKGEKLTDEVKICWWH